VAKKTFGNLDHSVKRPGKLKMIIFKSVMRAAIEVAVFVPIAPADGLLRP
jgi:hypothetical protein